MSLSLWTVYDHPSDYPNSYVARRFRIVDEGRDGGPEPEATADVIVASSLAAIREDLSALGLCSIARDAKDEPQIVEVWL